MNEMTLMTVEDAAHRLGASARMVRGWIARGDLRAVKVGSQWRLDPAQIQDLIPLKRAVEITQFTEKHLRELLCTGQVRGRKLGRRWFVCRAGNDFVSILATEEAAA